MRVWVSAPDVAAVVLHNAIPWTFTPGAPPEVVALLLHVACQSNESERVF